MHDARAHSVPVSLKNSLMKRVVPALESVPDRERHPAAQAVGHVPDAEAELPGSQPEGGSTWPAVGEMEAVVAGKEGWD